MPWMNGTSQGSTEHLPSCAGYSFPGHAYVHGWSADRKEHWAGIVPYNPLHFLHGPGHPLAWFPGSPCPWRSDSQCDLSNYGKQLNDTLRVPSISHARWFAGVGSRPHSPSGYPLLRVVLTGPALQGVLPWAACNGHPVHFSPNDSQVSVRCLMSPTPANNRAQ